MADVTNVFVTVTTVTGNSVAMILVTEFTDTAVTVSVTIETHPYCCC